MKRQIIVAIFAAAAFVGCQDQSGTGDDTIYEPSGASSTPQSEQADPSSGTSQSDSQRGQSQSGTESSATNGGTSGSVTNGTATPANP